MRKDGKGKDNNHKIRKEIEEKVKKWKEKAVMVLGDFNAHVKMLEPERNQDDSGDIITSWVDSDKIDLMLLNADTTKCEGLYTRTEKDSKSAIDLVLVNSRMYNLCKKMNIDEEKDIISFSDHNLIEIKLNSGVKVNKSFGSKYIMEEYYTKNKNKIKEWSERVKEKWKERGSNRNIIPMLKDMEEEGEKILKKKVKRRIGGREGRDIECEWMTDEIREVIKAIRKIRKEERKCNDEKQLEELVKQREDKKKMKNRMIREEKTRVEMEIKKEIENSDNKGKRIWKGLDKLRGIRKEEKVDAIYEEGQKLGKQEGRTKFFKAWEEIYRKDTNEIGAVWTKEIKQKLIEEHDKEEKMNHKQNGLREHMDMATEIGSSIRPMKAKRMTENDLKDIMEKLKDNKAPGPDGMRGEYFKELFKDQECKEFMIDCFNSVLEEKEIPDSWSVSRTKMIEKTKKPTVKDFRPVAITNVSYKAYMAFRRRDISEHLIMNNLVLENQIGFTEGGRIEYNHFILQYIVERSMKNNEEKKWEMPSFYMPIREGDNQSLNVGRPKRIKEETKKDGLIVMALDFKKAYDSVNRKSLIETLIAYKIDPEVIDLIAKVYLKDKTSIEMMGEKKEIEITSGIRQGCTVSTELFKLVTYVIIKKLEEEGETFELEDMNLSSLWFADDSLSISKSMEAAKKI